MLNITSILGKLKENFSTATVAATATNQLLYNTVSLIRLEKSSTATYGMLLINGHLSYVTLENPDLNNEKNVSCIPEGVYYCAIKESPSHGTIYEVTNVANRSGILIHSGNTASDTEGCILLGKLIDRNNERVLSSRVAVSEFMATMGNKPFLLYISCLTSN